MADFAGDEPVVAHSDETAVDDFQQRVEDAETAGAELTARESEERTLRETADVIEELHRIVENVAADDDVPDSTVDAIREVANMELRRIGTRLADTPTTESWHTPKERLMLSTESIGETLKKVWEAIKKAAERLYDALVKLVMSFIGVLESALRLAKDMQADLPGMNWGSAEPIASNRAKELSIQNKLTATWPKDVLTTLQQIATTDDEVFDIAEKISEEYIADFQQAIRAKQIAQTFSAQAARCKTFYVALRQKLAGIAAQPTPKPEPSAAHTVIYSSGLLPGEQRIQMRMPVETEGDIPFMVGLESAMSQPGGIKRDVFPQNAAKPEISRLPATEKAVLSDAVDGLVSLLEDLLKATKERQAKVKALRGKVTLLNGSLLQALTDDSADGRTKQLLAVLAKMAQFPLAIDRPVNKYLLHLVPHYVAALRQTVKAYS